jgi:hypothetical protein
MCLIQRNMRKNSRNPVLAGKTWGIFVVFKGTIHCKKELAIFPSPAGMSLTKLYLAWKKLNYSRLGRVWSVTSRLGTGKRLTLFYSVAWRRNRPWLLYFPESWKMKITKRTIIEKIRKCCIGTSHLMGVTGFCRNTIRLWCSHTKYPCVPSTDSL